MSPTARTMSGYLPDDHYSEESVLIRGQLSASCTNLMELTPRVSARKFLITATTIPVASKQRSQQHNYSLSKVTAVTKTARKWQVYRNKCLIRAKQLNRALTFVDSLGREHRGKKGDYLVESDGGSRRIWPRELFEDSHVCMEPVSPGSDAFTGGLRERNRNPRIPKRIGPKGSKDLRCAKPASQPRTLAVNSLRYNM